MAVANCANVAGMDLLGNRESLRGYALCGEPRCGSTYLARLCRSTGLLGHPREYFSGLDRVRSVNASPEAHLAQWVGQTVTRNGVYGLKVFANQFDLARKSRWAEHLPNLRFVHIERLNVLEQAISLVRARQTLAFERGQAAQGEPVYNQRNIASTLERIALNQARWSCWFARNGIAPLRLTYEGIASHPRSAVDLIAEQVGIEVPPPIEPAMEIQRDRLSDAWRERFLAESRDLGYLDYPSAPMRPWLVRLKGLLR
jgi:trehalose 2-sulfotransferase